LLFGRDIVKHESRRVLGIRAIRKGTAKQVKVGGRTLAVFNVGGTYYAIDDARPHRGASLAEGDVAGNEVTCPWHGARFDMSSGAHLSPPAPRGVTAYKVQVVGDEIQVEVP
jgi:nitrite reductase/ring-hydroxylating ferredoxin subunit